MQRKKFSQIAKVMPFVFMYLFLLSSPMVVHADTGAQEIGKVLPTASGTIADVEAGVGNYVYVAEYSLSNVLLVVDISTPSTPVVIGTEVRGVTAVARCIDVNDDETIAVIGASNFLLVFDISDKANPNRTVAFTTGGGTIYDVEIVGDLVYCACQSNLRVINISDIYNPTIHYIHGSGVAAGVDYDATRNVLYVAGGNSGGAMVWGLFPNGTPYIRDSISLQGNFGSCIEKLSDTRIAAGDDYGIIYIIDTTNLDDISILGSMDVGSWANEIAYNTSLGNYLLVAEYNDNLNVVSFSSASSPSLTRKMTASGDSSGEGVSIMGNYVYFAAYHALYIYNLSDCIPSGIADIPGFNILYLLISMLLIVPVVIFIKKQRINIL